MNSVAAEALASNPVIETSPTVFPQLQTGEVHVWQAFLDAPLTEQDIAVISVEEAERADRYRFELDRVRFVNGRARLRMILGRYLDRDPAELVLACTPQGKPRLVLQKGEAPLHFNVSHSDGIALYAVSREGAVGVDIERLREITDWAEIAGTVFTPQEQERLRALPAAWRMRGFIEAWTRQEAFLKATGEGLTGDLPAASDPRQSGYALHALTPAPGYLATLACAFEASRVIFLNWSDVPTTTAFSEIET